MRDAWAIGYRYLASHTASHSTLQICLPLRAGRLGRIMDWFDRTLVRNNMPTGAAYLLHARKRVAAHLDVGAKSSSRPRLISIPLGKTQEGVPVPRQINRSQPDGAEGT